MRSRVLPMTVKLLRSIAETAMRGFKRPVMAMGMAMTL
jgi:hypothetical protein